MSREMVYHFRWVEACNMCQAPVSEARVLGHRMNRSQGIRPTSLVGISTTVMQCRKCFLIFANPQPIPADIQQHYGVPPEAYWEAVRTQPEPNYFAREVRRFLELHGSESGRGLKALDIGAGLGKSMRVMMNAGFEVQGIEPSRPFRDRALSDGDIVPEQLQLASVEDATFAPGEFDFISFSAVVEHLYDPSEAILAALRWLAPGGLIQIEVPSSHWLSAKIFNLIYRLQGLNHVGNISPMHRPYHLYEFGLDSFRRHAELHAYHVTAHEYLVTTTQLPRFVDPVVRPVMKWTNSGMQLEVWLAHRK